ncbi:MAG: hypothetical protein WC749_10380 [Dehalococcoidia bacterium]
MSQSERRALDPDWHWRPIVWRTSIRLEELRIEAYNAVLKSEWLYTEVYTLNGVTVTQLLR